MPQGKGTYGSKVGRPNIGQVSNKRSKVASMLKSKIMPKLKELYPVSDKDVAFLKKTMGNMTTKQKSSAASMFKSLKDFKNRKAAKTKRGPGSR